jgi:cytochrome b561
MLIVGFVLSGIPKTEPMRHVYLGLHKTLGITLLGLAALRVLSRLFTAAPPLPDIVPTMQRTFARVAYICFYGLMFLMPVSGYVKSISMGQPVRWFGVDVARLLAEDRVRGLIAGDVHSIAAYFLVALIAVHVLAVVWHYFFDRVNLLRRMV